MEVGLHNVWGLQNGQNACGNGCKGQDEPHCQIAGQPTRGVRRVGSHCETELYLRPHSLFFFGFLFGGLVASWPLRSFFLGGDTIMISYQQGAGRRLDWHGHHV